MKVKQLKEILASLDDDTELFIRNSVNPFGNIQSLDQIELSTYGFFGVSVPCVILNTDSSKELETNEEDETIDLIKEGAT